MDYTQKKLSEESGVSEPYLSRIENGFMQPTGHELLARLAKALQLSEAEEAELFADAKDSQKIISLPADLSIKGYKVAHRFLRSLASLKDDRLDSIARVLSEEEK